MASSSPASRRPAVGERVPDDREDPGLVGGPGGTDGRRRQLSPLVVSRDPRRAACHRRRRAASALGSRPLRQPSRRVPPWPRLHAHAPTPRAAISVRPARRRRCVGREGAPLVVRGTPSVRHRPAGHGRRSDARRSGPPAQALADVSTDGIHPLPTGVSELDRVMGGGVVAGSVTLLFGPPGIGKSTLLFQVLSSLAATGLDVMLASAEESLAQVRGRASRIGLVPRNLLAIEGPDVEAIEAAVERHRPALVVVDSLQSVSDPELGQPAGSLAQVRTCVERLTRMAKSSGVPLLLVGHVTKDGDLAGPRAVEHLVDTVLSFDGDRHHALRVPDVGQAPLRTGRRGRHLRNPRRRPAPRARSRAAVARGSHGRCPRQRGRTRPAGPPPAARGGAGVAGSGRRRRQRTAASPDAGYRRGAGQPAPRRPGLPHRGGDPGRGPDVRRRRGRHHRHRAGGRPGRRPGHGLGHHGHGPAARRRRVR